MAKTTGLMAQINPFEMVSFFGFLLAILETFQVMSISFLGSSIDTIAPLLGIIFLFAGYMSGEVRAFDDLVDWEYLVLAVTLFFLISVKWIPTVSDYILGTQIYSYIVVAVSIICFVTLALRREV